MDAEFKGSSEHAAQHAHGVQHRVEPPAPQTIEQRVAALEAKVAKLEAEKEPLDAVAKR
jgi:hypothetical protein